MTLIKVICWEIVQIFEHVKLYYNQLNLVGYQKRRNKVGRGAC